MSSCSCVGIQKNSCSCAIFSNILCARDSKSSNYIFVSNKQNLDYAYERKKPGIFHKILRDVYDMCVAYNIRHCGYIAGNGRDRNIKHALLDCILLLCFLVANTVVFLTLLTRTVCHMSSIIFNLFTWIQRTLSKNLKIYLNNEYSEKEKAWMSSMDSQKMK